ncbi:MAG: diadenosine tetraphosphatase [Myxococcales bacterium]|nr:diadenosine tetraphosphatase [Myxococcales bacterium]
MATYAIGDIQGCYETLCRLLDRIGYTRGQDRLWLVGDLINRGPSSEKVLRWAYEQGDSVQTVLGNHDLHLLAVATGVRPITAGDTLQAVLDAPDADQLIEWLRHRPLLVEENGWLMVHAGLHPSWDASLAISYARELEAALQGPTWQTFLTESRKKPCPGHADECHSPEDHQRYRLAVLTRMRALHPDHRLDLDYKGPLDSMAPTLHPWFAVTPRASADHRIVCGHWAALGVHHHGGVFSLDSGCVWGGSLTALRLEDTTLFSEPAADSR